MEEGMRPRRTRTALARTFVLLCPLPLLLLTVSCASMDMKHASEDSFNLVVENFHNAIKWGEYQTAATFVGPTMQEDFWKIADSLQNRVSIMECQIKRSSFATNGRSGDVVLLVRYYAKNKPEVITRTINEHWRFFDKEKMWYLVSHDLSLLEN